MPPPLEGIYNRRMSRVSNLYRLQELDLERERALARMEEIDRLLGEDSELRIAEQNALAAEDQLKQAQSLHRQAEHALAAQRAKIEENEAKLYGGSITNPKELQDLQQELDSLKRFLETLEDRMLEAMIGLEEAEEAYQAASQHLEDLRIARSAKHQDLAEERERLQAALARIQDEREAALAGIEEQDLRTYEQLRTRFGGIVLALVRDGSCSICGVDLARSKLQEVQGGGELIRCSQCGRILYAG